MVSSARMLAALSLLLGAHACAKADSVELGGACKQQVECKDPADTCMTLGTDMLCTVACSAEAPCPSGHACAKMDVRVEGDGGAGKASAQGYCLPESRVGAHVVTIAPKGEGKAKPKSKGKGQGKSSPKGDDAE